MNYNGCLPFLDFVKFTEKIRNEKHWLGLKRAFYNETYKKFFELGRN